VDLGASEAPIEPTLARELAPAPAAAEEPAVSEPEAAALEAEMTGAETPAAEAETASDGAPAASE
jgi:small subunit ribosomal protein S2